jgi:hypothetical protein
LCSGAGQVPILGVGSLIELLIDELEFIGPLLHEVAAHPRFCAFSQILDDMAPDDALKGLAAARDRISFLASYIPGHIYLLAYSICLLQCSIEQNVIEWNDLRGQLSILVPLLFKHIILPFIPALSCYLLCVRDCSRLPLDKSSRKGEVIQSVLSPLHDGGYIELVLMITNQALLQSSLDIPDVDLILPALLRLLNSVYSAYNDIDISRFKDLEQLEHFSDSHPLTLASKALEVLKRLCHMDPISCATSIVSSGFFENLFTWLNSDVPVKRGALEQVIDCWFCSYIQ